MKIRKLTDGGVTEFANHLAALKSDPRLPPPMGLLTDPGASEPLVTDAEVELREFATRFDAAEYLYRILTDSGIPNIDKDRGLWSWLTLFYFEQLCPSKKGQRVVGEEARYIPLFAVRRYYRHLIYGPFALYRMYSNKPDILPVLMTNPLHVATSEMFRSYIENTEILASPSTIEVAKQLYYDSEKKKLRRGAGDKANGSVRRLIEYFQQVKLTYDLPVIKTEKLMNMLPKEFDYFKSFYRNSTKRLI